MGPCSSFSEVSSILKAMRNYAAFKSGTEKMILHFEVTLATG